MGEATDKLKAAGNKLAYFNAQDLSNTAWALLVPPAKTHVHTRARTRARTPLPYHPQSTTTSATNLFRARSL